ncbi:uncharacterized protein Obp49a [Calliphora vicina]|uniref:uncharacterized protein Obp49a n=1 Tax=Calliphora vicina TaxID=7373 RepID=UPI00325B30F3
MFLQKIYQCVMVRTQQYNNLKMAYRFLAITILAALMQTCLTAGTDCKKMPPRVDPATCCPIPELITEENKENCKEFLIEPKPSFVPMANEKPSGNAKKLSPTPAEHNGSDHYRRIHHGPFMHLCFMNCALNDTGILSNGKLNEATLSTHLKKILTATPDLIPILETSFKTCSAKAEQIHEKMQEKFKNRKTTVSSTTPANISKDRMFRLPRCAPVASHIMACVFMETFMNCPDSVWSKAKECNGLRNHMLDCKPKHSMEDSASNSTEED